MRQLVERDGAKDVQDLPVSGSVHRVARKYRWLTTLLVPALVALMCWAAYESIHNNLGDDGEIQTWVVLFSILVFGGMSLVFILGLVWAFRAKIVIDAEKMFVHGTFSSTIITADRMEGFRWVNGQFYLCLKDRSWPIQIGYLENMWLIIGWIKQRTQDIAEVLSQEEDRAISSDRSLGLTEADKEGRLKTLRSVIQRLNYVAYLAAGASVVNFLFVENVEVELIAVGTLVLIPFFLDWLAVLNRGHIRIDYDEGSRYPQIFTATITAGFALALVSLLNRGALLDTYFYELLFVGMLAKGMVWVFIESDRMQDFLRRGRVIAVITIAAMFVIPGMWVGGSIYQANKLLDTSPTTWHATEILEKKISSGKTTSYTVELAPWDPAQDGAVEYTLRRKEFERYEAGMPVRVGVRAGALGISWASALQPAESTSGENK